MKAKGVSASRPLVVGASAAGLILALVLVTPTAQGSRLGSIAGASPLGLWYAEGGAARVEVAQCGENLCGTVTWLRSPLDEDGCELRDRNNPDPALRSRRVLGLEVLHASGASEAGRAQCTIYDPGSGRTYSCALWLDGSNRLRLRGYVGVPLIGRTTTWLRVGSEARVCEQKPDA
jgi:uncharacterized protein (DUF2147 family)